MLSKKIKLMIFGIFCVFFILSIASSINQYSIQFSIEKGVFNQDLIYKLMGESRRIFSRLCMMRADEYFHGGVTLASKKCRYGLNQKEENHEEHHHEHEQDISAFKEVEAIEGVSKWNFLLYMAELINIDKHMHLRVEEQKEMIPWYVFATQLDPHNVHAYEIGGHWIGKVLNLDEEGIQFLKRGLSANPNAWEIYYSLGEIYIDQKKDYATALEYFRKAADLFTKENVTPHESWQVYMFIASCHEQLGHQKEALITYKNILKVFPEDKVSLYKIKELSF